MTTITNMATPELLSPAGDWEAMRAAVANGADAVYFGLDHFNARFRAKNFALAELPKIMDYLHSHNVKGFVTFNTLIFSDELPEATEYLKEMAGAGVDAVLVQDLGVADLLHRLAPTLPIHGSTQMTLTEPRGIKFVQNLGVQRVVLARELSVGDISKIAGALRPAGELGKVLPELEVFIHGALCVSYSGQCLTSESLGGRSANRGQCAQACRLPYKLIVDGVVKDLGDKQYLLSPSDLAAYDLIGELTNLGVSCFKIEGRLKSAHYVAATTQTYRAAIDTATGGGTFAINDQQKMDLEQSFSRGFTHGFLGGVNHQQLVSAKYSNARGTRIGTVDEVGSHTIVVKLEGRIELKPGDGVLFDEGRPEQDEQGGRIFETRMLGNGRLEIALGYGDVNLAYIQRGAIVWKTDDPHIKKRLAHSFARDTVVNRLPLTFKVQARVGEHLKLTAEAEGRRAEAAYSEKALEAARKFPFDEKTAREQLNRLGDSPYELAGVELDLAGGPMVPKSVLNDLRRNCVEQLVRQRERAHAVAEPDVLEKLRAEVVQDYPVSLPAASESTLAPAGGAAGLGLKLTVLVRTMEQLTAALTYAGPIKPSWIYADFEDVRRYKEAVAACRAAGVPIALATLRIVKPGEEGLLKQIADCAPDAVLVRTLAAVSYYRQMHPSLPQIGDYSLNVSNELTAALLARSGLIRLTPNYDLNWKQLAAMFSRVSPAMFECVIHQHMPMFHMEHCVFAHTLSNGKDFHDCGRPCDHHKVDLGDRVGEGHPLIPDVGCRNTVFNGQAQSASEYVPEMRGMGITTYRIELLREDGPAAGRVIDQYSRLLAGETVAPKVRQSLRVLNQLGVTAGTMERE